jgi:hypothetical protein
MRRFLLLVPCLCILFFAKGQEPLELQKSIPFKATLFTTDPVGNIYLISSSNAVYRYNNQGDSIGFFNEIKKGKITQIDATNPLRILLYYAEYSQIVVLDRLLTKKSAMRLNNSGLFNVNCVANSADGNIWIFEPASGTLLKIDDKVDIRQSTALKTLLPENLDPCFMVEQDRNLFMVDSLEGIKRFDQFGFYKTTYAFQTKEVQFINDYLIYYKAPHLYSYHTTTLEEQKLEVPLPNDVKQVRVERNLLYVLRSDRLDIYPLSKK